MGANSHLLSRYEGKRAINGQHYFVLKAFKGRVIGTSEMYASASSVNRRIEAVIEYGRSKRIGPTKTG
ncbi:YegP family protein [Dyadobacter fanqingshengii]|nr:YegP family protein [Dyadobacter fanqingshengii]